MKRNRLLVIAILALLALPLTGATALAHGKGKAVPKTTANEILTEHWTFAVTEFCLDLDVRVLAPLAK